MKRTRLVNIILISLVICALLLTAANALNTPKIKVAQASSDAVQTSNTAPIPVLAYYYIWYDSNSWSRRNRIYLSWVVTPAMTSP